MGVEMKLAKPKAQKHFFGSVGINVDISPQLVGKQAVPRGRAGGSILLRKSENHLSPLDPD